MNLNDDFRIYEIESKLCMSDEDIIFLFSINKERILDSRSISTNYRFFGVLLFSLTIFTYVKYTRNCIKR